ncbi:MAG: P-II family nitrogen regulator [Thermodesulfobacteriota bacterium]|nr:P-II family nitrogen regulator [Thermodesulfobacteriota bacterium]
MNFKLVISMIKSQKTDRVVDAAKAAGATGATIIPARGTGIREAKTFFGLTLEVQTDVVLFLLEEELIEPVLAAIQEAGQFKDAGTGIAFVLNVEQTIGVRSQIEHLRQK